MRSCHTTETTAHEGLVAITPGARALGSTRVRKVGGTGNLSQRQLSDVMIGAVRREPRSPIGCAVQAPGRNHRAWRQPVSGICGYTRPRLAGLRAQGAWRSSVSARNPRAELGTGAMAQCSDESCQREGRGRNPNGLVGGSIEPGTGPVSLYQGETSLMLDTRGAAGVQRPDQTSNHSHLDRVSVASQAAGRGEPFRGGNHSAEGSTLAAHGGSGVCGSRTAAFVPHVAGRHRAGNSAGLPLCRNHLLGADRVAERQDPRARGTEQSSALAGAIIVHPKQRGGAVGVAPRDGDMQAPIQEHIPQSPGPVLRKRMSPCARPAPVTMAVPLRRRVSHILCVSQARGAGLAQARMGRPRTK